jgi:hypothetical protein
VLLSKNQLDKLTPLTVRDTHPIATKFRVWLSVSCYEQNREMKMTKSPNYLVCFILACFEQG